ncbi:MAG: hypothetical protein ACI8TQ_003798 [Planctomycetota bacterium]|jgi:hypothetical protein
MALRLIHVGIPAEFEQEVQQTLQEAGSSEVWIEAGGVFGRRVSPVISQSTDSRVTQCESCLCQHLWKAGRQHQMARNGLQGSRRHAV